MLLLCSLFFVPPHILFFNGPIAHPSVVGRRLIYAPTQREKNIKEATIAVRWETRLPASFLARLETWAQQEVTLDLCRFHKLGSLDVKLFDINVKL
jgi:hypothetical protein